MKCKICKKDTLNKSKLCPGCNTERLAAASYERTWQGTGLTYTNAEKYSEDNWIKAYKRYLKENK